MTRTRLSRGDFKFAACRLPAAGLTHFDAERTSLDWTALLKYGAKYRSERLGGASEMKRPRSDADSFYQCPVDCFSVLTPLVQWPALFTTSHTFNKSPGAGRPDQ